MTFTFQLHQLSGHEHNHGCIFNKAECYNNHLLFNSISISSVVWILSEIIHKNTNNIKINFPIILY